MDIKKLHELFLKSPGTATDTRKITNKSIFFALKGENFNGNSFATKALESGASYAVIDEKPEEENGRFILVDNVLETLQALASFHRKFLNLPIIALTGSNGKTTTKELINAVLSQKFKTAATKGNLNNHIGVPLTLLSMTKDTEIGIVEMGANHVKEIAFLSRIAKPDYGYITNFGKAHLEGFKSLEGVVQGKSELYDYLKQDEKTLFLNFDDPIQKKQRDYSKTFSFGNRKGVDVFLEFPKPIPFASVKWGNSIFKSNLIGPYNAVNMAAAISMGIYFKVTTEKIKEALENYTPTNNRSQVIEKNSIKIILDAYNANPTSMAAALDNFETMPENQKTVILGDMFELGALSEEEHQQLVTRLESSAINNVYLIGEKFHATSSGEKIKKFKTFEEFKARFDPAETKDNLILIKGSRGMALERILEFL